MFIKKYVAGDYSHISEEDIFILTEQIRSNVGNDERYASDEDITIYVEQLKTENKNRNIIYINPLALRENIDEKLFYELITTNKNQETYQM